MLLSLLVHLPVLAGSSPVDRAVLLQQQIDAAIASRAPATIELSGTYNFNRSSLLIIGSSSQLTLRPSPSCVAPGCIPELARIEPKQPNVAMWRRRPRVPPV